MQGVRVCVGDLVEYWSSSHSAWLTTKVEETTERGFRLRGKSSILAWDTQTVRAAQPGTLVGSQRRGAPPGGITASAPSAETASGSAVAAGCVENPMPSPGAPPRALGPADSGEDVPEHQAPPHAAADRARERSRGTWDPEWGKLLDDSMAAHKTVANLLHNLHASYPSEEHMSGLRQMLVTAFPMTAAHHNSPFLGMPSAVTMTGVVHPPRA